MPYVYVIPIAELKPDSAPAIMNMIMTLQDAINGHLSGDNLKVDSITAREIASGVITRVELAVTALPKEYHVPLIAAEAAASTTATALTNVGPAIHWDPSMWQGATVYFEAVLWVANSAATGTAALKNAAGAVIGQVTATATGATLLRTAALTMPTAVDTLQTAFSTNNASYACYLLGARLVIQY